MKRSDIFVKNTWEWYETLYCKSEKVGKRVRNKYKKMLHKRNRAVGKRKLLKEENNGEKQI